MKNKYIRLLAATATLFTGASCSVSVAPLNRSGGHSCGQPQMRRGPIPVNSVGIPIGNQSCGNQQYVGDPYGSSFGGIPYGGSQYGSPYGSQYGDPYGSSSGSRVQDNGSLRWDHRSSVVKIPISGSSRNRSPYGTSQYGGVPTNGQPMASSGGGQFRPSGRTVECPGCHSTIRNAPTGDFPCQKPGCGATVHN